ncbi:MAG: 30S ribosomal protein S6 [Bacteroidota bacterium]
MAALKHYETIIIFSPDLNEEELEKKSEEYITFLKKQKAEIVHSSVSSKKKLAYPIQKKAYGFYQSILFKGAPTIIDPLELQYRRSADVLRFMTLSLDEEAVLYKEKKRTEKANQKSEQTNDSQKDNA